MADRTSAASTCARYIELLAAGDVDGIVALYAEEASVEDPVGSEPHVGVEAIEAFYRSVLPAGGVPAASTGPARVVGSEVAFPFEVRYGDDLVVPVIDVMRFDSQGRITSMRAFWSAP